MLVLGLAIAVLLILVAVLVYQLPARLREQWQNAQLPLSQQVGQTSQLVETQLSSLRQLLQGTLASTSQLAQQAQQNIANELRALVNQFGAVQQMLQQNTQQISTATQTLHTILVGSRTRGAVGEVILEQILQERLPAESFQSQFRFSDGGIVDAVVHLGQQLIPIDSKFPLDAFQRMQQREDDTSRREFIRAVRKHADDIARKYIRPQEGTLDFALMFVPSESVYSAMLTTSDGDTTLDAYCRQQRVIPVSPNTLYAYLGAILMGLRGMQIEENARQILRQLEGLHRQLDKFADTHSKLGRHLGNAYQAFLESQRDLTQVQGLVGQLSTASPASLPAGPPVDGPSRD